MVSQEVLLTVALLGSPAASDEPGLVAVEAVSPGAPDTYALVGQRCPTFSWAGAGEAAAYELMVLRLPEDEAALDAAIKEPRLRLRLPGTARTWTASGDHCLSGGERYAWLVRSLGEANGDDWSRALFFRTPATPSPEEVAEALDMLQSYLTASGVTAIEPFDALAAIGDGPSRSNEPRSPAPAASDRAQRPGVGQQTLAVADETGLLVAGGDSGVVFGLHAVQGSDKGGSAAVVGESTAVSGDVAGVFGKSASPTGAAGVFDASGGGDILRGLSSGREVFSIDDGGVLTTGTVATNSLQGPAGAAFFATGSSCGDNSHVSGVSSEGTISCSPDSGDISAVNVGNGLSGGGSQGAVSLAHADTSSQASISASLGGPLVLQQIGLDGFGHVTNAEFGNLDGRYLNASGDSLTGSLDITGGTDVGPGGGGYLTLGSTSARNVALDNNEIMARDNGVAAALYLQVEGGTVSVGTNDTDETLNVGGNVRLTGELKRPATGDSNLVPIAYGRIAFLSGGIVDIKSGTGNFSVTRIGEGEGRFSIEVDGVPSDSSKHTFIVSSGSYINKGLIGGDLVGDGTFSVSTWSFPLGLPDDRAFSFVIYEH